MKLPDEHPDVTLATMRNRWLFADKDFPQPEGVLEFLQETHDILFEWYERWHTLWEKVNPKMFRDKDAREAWLREQDLKSLAVWHALRSMREYWHECGVWEGNPYDPSDHGKFVAGPMKKGG